MKAIFTYPQNAGTSYIDPVYIGDDTSGFQGRIKELLDGNYRPWAGTSPTGTVADVMSELSKFNNATWLETADGNNSINQFWQEPLLIGSVELIEEDISNATAVDNTPAELNFSSAHGFTDGLHVTLSGFDGSYTQANNQSYYVKRVDSDTIQLALDPALSNIIEWRLQETSTITGSTTVGSSPITFTAVGHTLQTGTPVIIENTNGVMTQYDGATNFYAVRVTNDTFRLSWDAAGTDILAFTSELVAQDVDSYETTSTSYEVTIPSPSGIADHSSIVFDDITQSQQGANYTDLIESKSLEDPDTLGQGFGLQNSLSNDGLTMAVSESPTTGALTGLRIYEYDGPVTQWDEVLTVEESVLDMQLSGDGETLVIYTQPNGFITGSNYSMKVYKKSGSVWAEDTTFPNVTSTWQQTTTYFKKNQLSISDDGTKILYYEYNQPDIYTAQLSAGSWFWVGNSSSVKTRFVLTNYVQTAALQCQTFAISGDGQVVVVKAKSVVGQSFAQYWCVCRINNGAEISSSTQYILTPGYGTDDTAWSVDINSNGSRAVFANSKASSFPGVPQYTYVGYAQTLEIVPSLLNISKVNEIKFDKTSNPEYDEFGTSVALSDNVALGQTLFVGGNSEHAFIITDPYGTPTLKQTLTSGNTLGGYGNQVSSTTDGLYFVTGGPISPSTTRSKLWHYSASQKILQHKLFEYTAIQPFYLKTTGTTDVYTLYTDEFLTSKQFPFNLPIASVAPTVGPGNYTSTVGLAIHETTAGTINEYFTPESGILYDTALTDATTGTVTIHASATSRYRLNNIDILTYGNTEYLQRTGESTYVNNAQVSTTEYWTAGSSEFIPATVFPQGLTVQTNASGYITGFTGLDSEFPGAFSDPGDILFKVQTVPDTYTPPGPTPVEQQDIWDLADQWLSDGETTPEKEWPHHVTPMSATIVVNTPTIVNRSQNGFKYARKSGFTKWTLEVQYPPMSAADFQTFQGIAQAAQGQATPFYFVLRNRDGNNILWGDWNNDPNTTQPTLKEAVTAGSTTMLFEGFGSNTPKAFATGEVILGDKNQNGYLRTVINEVSSNVYGEAKIRIAYPLREAHAIGTEWYKNPYHAVVTLNNDDFQYSVDTAGYYNMSVSFDLDGWK